LDTAKRIRSEDPEAAFRIYLEVADSGVAWAMESVGYLYEEGIIVAKDCEQAMTYYRRAIEAGSWMATLKYASLLADLGHFDTCETILQDGVQADFVPAFYWLARVRLKRSKNRRTCCAIRPLLEHAADAGHPAAALLLARLKFRGKFGIREIPQGFRESLQVFDRTYAADSAAEASAIPEAA